MWQTAQDAAHRLGEDMPTLAADIKRLQGMMNAAWQGAAADVASQGRGTVGSGVHEHGRWPA